MHDQVCVPNQNCNSWLISNLYIMQVGHAGTLDPGATGLLVVCTGAGTKFVDDYQAMEKEYSGQ